MSNFYGFWTCFDHAGGIGTCIKLSRLDSSEIYVIVKNDEEEATFRYSDGNSSRFTLHASRSLRIVGKVTEKEKRY